MKIITIAHQKGGVGKSTLALNVAGCFRAAGINTAIVDMDLQGSIHGLKEVYTEITILSPPTQLENLQSLPYDTLIIDTPPYLTNTLSDLFLLSHFILVPTKTGFFDVMAIKSTVALIQQALSKKPSIKAAIVLNMVKSRSAITEEVKQVLAEYGISILSTMIFDRVSYIRSTLTGGVITTDDKKAKEEMTDLINEIVETLN